MPSQRRRPITVPILRLPGVSIYRNRVRRAAPRIAPLSSRSRTNQDETSEPFLKLGKKRCGYCCCRAPPSSLCGCDDLKLFERKRCVLARHHPAAEHRYSRLAHYQGAASQSVPVDSGERRLRPLHSPMHLLSIRDRLGPEAPRPAGSSASRSWQRRLRAAAVTPTTKIRSAMATRRAPDAVRVV